MASYRRHFDRLEGEDDLADLAAVGEVGVGVGGLLQRLGGGQWDVDASRLGGGMPGDGAGQATAPAGGAQPADRANPVQGRWRADGSGCQPFGVKRAVGPALTLAVGPVPAGP